MERIYGWCGRGCGPLRTFGLILIWCGGVLVLVGGGLLDVGIDWSFEVVLGGSGREGLVGAGRDDEMEGGSGGGGSILACLSV